MLIENKGRQTVGLHYPFLLSFIVGRLWSEPFLTKFIMLAELCDIGNQTLMFANLASNLDYIAIYKSLPLVASILIRIIFELLQLNPTLTMFFGSLKGFVILSFMAMESFDWKLLFCSLLVSRTLILTGLYSSTALERNRVMVTFNYTHEQLPSFTFYHFFTFGKALGWFVRYFLGKNGYIVPAAFEALSAFCYFFYIYYGKAINHLLKIVGGLCFISITLTFFLWLNLDIIIQLQSIIPFLSAGCYFIYCFFVFERNTLMKVISISIYEMTFGIIRGFVILLPISFETVTSTNTFNLLITLTNCFIIQFLCGSVILRYSSEGWISRFMWIGFILFAVYGAIGVKFTDYYYVFFACLILSTLENFCLGETQDIIFSNFTKKEGRYFHITTIYSFLSLSLSISTSLIKRYDFLNHFQYVWVLFLILGIITFISRTILSYCTLIVS